VEALLSACAIGFGIAFVFRFIWWRKIDAVIIGICDGGDCYGWVWDYY
jgi:hypothetical protein